jgi:23S rRNA pseudouridine2605 synthase
MLNKPRYVLSSTTDERGRKTVLDLVDVEERLFPVGRLDLESEGLILLTNDGDLTHKLTHPSFEHEREYEVLVKGEPNRETLRRWQTGNFEVDGKPVGPMQVEPLTPTGPGWLRIILKEGRKRQIRKIAEQLGHPVITLVRVRFGPLKLGKLKPGNWRHLTPREVDGLRRSVGKKRPHSSG